MPESTLLMHTPGCQRVSPADLGRMETPEPTKSHYPIPHAEFYGMVEEAVEATGFTILNRDLGVAQMGAELFGIFDLDHNRDDVKGFSVGFRHAHNKTLSAQVMFGRQLFVCDNRVFSGQQAETASHKHTVNVMTTMPVRIQDALGRFADWTEQENERIDRLQAAPLDDRSWHSLVVNAAKRGCMSWAQIRNAENIWHTDERYGGPDSKTLWRAENSINATWQMGRANNLSTPLKRGQRLTTLLDTWSNN